MPGDALLVVTDMQKVVAEDTPWRIDGVEALVPPITALVGAFSPSVLFTRHVPPADGGSGTWRRFYAAWRELARDPSVWDLMPELAARAGTVATKSIYSAFGARRLRQELERPDPPALVLCGVETDCCVLATVLDAVDRGIPVTIVEDAVASPSVAGHEGALALCRRLPEQVVVTTTAKLVGEHHARR